MGNNMFAYCNNNPIAFADTMGDMPHWIVGAAVGGIIGALSSAVTGGDMKDILINATAGAISGAVLSSTLNFRLAQSIACSVTGAATSIDCLLNGADLGTSLLCGVAAASITYGTSMLSGLFGTDRVASTIVDCTFGFGGSIVSSAFSTVATGISTQVKQDKSNGSIVTPKPRHKEIYKRGQTAFVC